MRPARSDSSADTSASSSPRAERDHRGRRSRVGCGKRACAGLAGGPILLAWVRTVGNAVRLGTREDDADEQSRLARAIYRDHLVCLAGITAFLALWLIPVLG